MKLTNLFFSGRFQMTGYVLEKYFIKGEGNYVIPYLLMIPAEPGPRGLIYLNPSGKAAEASEGKEMECLSDMDLQFWLLI